MGGSSQWKELCNYQYINIYIIHARDSYLPFPLNDNFPGVPQPGSLHTGSIFKPQNCEGHAGDPRSFAPVQQHVSFAPPETLVMGPLGLVSGVSLSFYSLFLFLIVCFRMFLFVMSDEGQAIQTQ